MAVSPDGGRINGNLHRILHRLLCGCLALGQDCSCHCSSITIELVVCLSHEHHIFPGCQAGVSSRASIASDHGSRGIGNRSLIGNTVGRSAHCSGRSRCRGIFQNGCRALDQNVLCRYNALIHTCGCRVGDGHLNVRQATGGSPCKAPACCFG